ncbi:hypothetical protein sos41_10190 [Alphaproteobacteria bacterium SO-S41]|nr:hypothetical protein sos41_10190 [Alphaproteobacteria bacterium SO-S41]
MTPTDPIPAEAAIVTKDVTLNAPPALVWAALRDFGAVDTRLAPGFVTACRLEGTARICTFANGSTAREELVAWDDAARRLTYTIPSERMTWHRATAEVHDAPGGGTRFVWTTAVAPAVIADYISPQMDLGVAAMSRTLEAAARESA